MIPQLFEKSWFHRMWVVQEVSLPDPKKVFVFCGNRYIRWKHLIRGVLRYGDIKKKILECMDIFIFLNGLLRPAKLRDYKRNRLQVRIAVGRPLSQLLAKTEKKLCQDSRDRIFALYAIFRALPVPFEPPPPDYARPLSAVEAEIRFITAVAETGSVWGIAPSRLSSGIASTIIAKRQIAFIGLPIESNVSEYERRLWQHNIHNDKFSTLDLPGLVHEIRSCWTIKCWIDTILDIIIAPKHVAEFRA
jgi:hypothetical protein